MNDLVTRLRRVSRWIIGTKGEAVMVPLAATAADEIERLQEYERFVKSTSSNELAFGGWQILNKRVQDAKTSDSSTQPEDGK